MPGLKPDADQIRDFLITLAEERWIKESERRWWPKFIFHYTDIRNAVNILHEGCLYSRKYLEDHQRLVVSSGSAAVLAGTDTAVKDCVRLYFRPKTPTQYYAEGLRSHLNLARSKFPDAHCPVPVFFLFDSGEILTRADCYFSDGGLGSSTHRILSTANELTRLPWKKIYHSGWIEDSKAEKSEIIFRRQAEAIIPRQLDLNALRYIYCRSYAERETFLHLLPSQLRNRYQDKIVTTTRSVLFYRRHTFIETVRLSSQDAQVNFSPETQSSGPFLFCIEMEGPAFNGQRQIEQFLLRDNYVWKFSFPPTAHYTIRLFLDHHLVYANSFEETTSPF